MSFVSLNEDGKNSRAGKKAPVLGAFCASPRSHRITTNHATANLTFHCHLRFTSEKPFNSFTQSRAGPHVSLRL